MNELKCTVSYIPVIISSVFLKNTLKELSFTLQFLHPLCLSIVYFTQLLLHVFDIALSLSQCLVQLLNLLLIHPLNLLELPLLSVSRICESPL
jgi:hypothetical protein